MCKHVVSWIIKDTFWAFYTPIKQFANKTYALLISGFYIQLFSGCNNKSWRSDFYYIKGALKKVKRKYLLRKMTLHVRSSSFGVKNLSPAYSLLYCQYLWTSESRAVEVIVDVIVVIVVIIKLNSNSTLSIYKISNSND